MWFLLHYWCHPFGAVYFDKGFPARGLVGVWQGKREDGIAQIPRIQGRCVSFESVSGITMRLPQKPLWHPWNPQVRRLCDSSLLPILALHDSWEAGHGDR